MSVLITILCSLMILIAIFLVVAVLMQSGKDNRLSGTIAGGADTFFGKTKGKTLDRVLSKATTVVAIIFVVLVFLVYVLQTQEAKNKLDTSGSGNNAGTEVVETVEGDEAEETATDEAEETATSDEVEETASAEEATTSDAEGEGAAE
ncbi:MAG: preprotein translocase subunit SecG [Clostridia bacterium]|nr:preprotein translocase subunit SecG [Clostridia bacterium]